MKHCQSAEIPYCHPLTLYELFHENSWSILFNSAIHNNESFGRFSYIAIEPFQTLWAKNGRIELNGISVSETNPLLLLKKLLNEFKQISREELPPFQGGAAGAFSYDLNQYIEPSAINPEQIDVLNIPDMAVGFFDLMISFDHQIKKAWIISTGWPEQESQKRQAHAKNRLNYLHDLISSSLSAKNNRSEAGCDSQLIHSNFTQTTYMNAVTQVKDYIREGDLFEANISQCFNASLNEELTPFNLYQRLMILSPAPFSAYLNLGQFVIASASPERFLKVIGSRVETRPIKGTRPRDQDVTKDKILAKELLSSEKDKSENIMIVDLMRNDLSKVCQDHSIRVTQLCALESYPNVHHLVSVVIGDLKPEFNAVDLLLATFPGGSISGAPKVRAMQIIAEIEPTKRGIYCGSLGFISFTGDMDMSIAIRTYTIKDKAVTFQAGGAVVLDSDPLAEYLETLTKSDALKKALVCASESV